MRVPGWGSEGESRGFWGGESGLGVEGAGSGRVLMRLMGEKDLDGEDKGGKDEGGTERGGWVMSDGWMGG